MNRFRSRKPEIVGKQFVREAGTKMQCFHNTIRGNNTEVDGTIPACMHVFCRLRRKIC